MTVTLALASLPALIAGATATFAQASSSMAELRGQVTDPYGAAIANAKLTLTDLVKGSSRVAASDGEGAYVFLGMPPSSYELQVEAHGFSASATRIELTVVRGRRDRKPSGSVGFTSAADPRQLQFGVRYNF